MTILASTYFFRFLYKYIAVSGKKISAVEMRPVNNNTFAPCKCISLKSTLNIKIEAAKVPEMYTALRIVKYKKILIPLEKQVIWMIKHCR